MRPLSGGDMRYAPYAATPLSILPAARTGMQQHAVAIFHVSFTSFLSLFSLSRALLHTSLIFLPSLNICSIKKKKKKISFLFIR